MCFDMEQEALEQERRDADIEMAELYAAGREASRRRSRSERLFAAGRLMEAAEACPHGGGYPLDSIAARNAGDPRAGQSGVRCDSCGSVLSGFRWDGPVTVVHPCDWRREEYEYDASENVVGWRR